MKRDPKFLKKIAVAALLLGGVSIAPAQTNLFTNETKIFASDAGTNKFFGYPVKYGFTTTNVMLVGSLDTNNGAVYNFHYLASNWVQSQKLGVPVTNSADLFGAAIAQFGDVLVIGQPQPFTNLGLTSQAYIYRNNNSNWVLRQTIFGPSSGTFGASVGANNKDIFVGNPQESSTIQNGGAVFVYRKASTNWNFLSTLRAKDQKTNTLFGTALAIENKTLVIGAPQATNSTNGAAYVFIGKGGGWKQNSKLLYTNLQTNAQFGASVAVEGKTIVVGAPGDTVLGTNGGAVYVFVKKNSGWKPQQRLISTSNTNDLGFGTSVAIQNKRILVGVPGESVGGTNGAGAAYVYRFNGTNWIVQQHLTASDAATNVNFGQSVDIASPGAIIGAPFDNEGATNAGAVYFYNY
jgi:hypothetical protein